MNTLPLIRKMAAILLAICFVLPLSKCTTAVSVDMPSEDGVQETVYYGYKMVLQDSQKTLKTDPAIGIFRIVLCLMTFFLPLAILALKPPPQSIVTLIGSVPSVYFLGLEFYVHTPLMGAWLALLSWIALVAVSLLTLWKKFNPCVTGAGGTES